MSDYFSTYCIGGLVGVDEMAEVLNRIATGYDLTEKTIQAITADDANKSPSKSELDFHRMHVDRWRDAILREATERGWQKYDLHSIAPLSIDDMDTPCMVLIEPAIAWLRESFPYPLADGLASMLEESRKRCNEEAQERHDRSTKWPWGNHETELLLKLEMAANKFWKLYDPADHTTAPTNEQVIGWLRNEKVSKRIAQAMATILRADDLPVGPRK